MRSHDIRIAKLEERSGRLPRPLADLYEPEIADILEHGSIDERDALRHAIESFDREDAQQ